MFDRSLCDLLSITDVALHILPYLGLKELFVLRCANRGIQNCVDNDLLSHVKKLNLCKISAVPPLLISRILPNCVRLQEIQLRNYLPIDDDQLQLLLKANRSSLRKIALTFLHGINLTAAGVQPILLDKCPRLHTLTISKCNWLTDGSLECFALHLNRNSLEQAKAHTLRTLDLSGCNQISSRALNLLLKSRCLHLTSLNLSNLLGSVQDETLQAIAINSALGKSIENLNIINCINITGRGLRYVDRTTFNHT